MFTPVAIGKSAAHLTGKRLKDSLSSARLLYETDPLTTALTELSFIHHMMRTGGGTPVVQVVAPMAKKQNKAPHQSRKRSNLKHRRRWGSS